MQFKIDDSYGEDNLSFLFSLNNKEKYPKNNYEKNESIWCYREYGPSFHWDLYFRKSKMNAVKFEKKNYLTPDNWVEKYKCFYNDSGILLDSLEIFQISINEKPEEDEDKDMENNLNEINTESSNNQKINK